MTAAEAGALKPCPFCSKYLVLMPITNSWEHDERRCILSLHWFAANDDRARDLWNIRADLPITDDLVDAVYKAFCNATVDAGGRGDMRAALTAAFEHAKGAHNADPS